MTSTRHGLSLGIERSGNVFFLSLKSIGRLTHADCESVRPMVESALLTVKESHVYALFDGSGMDSWEIDAVKDYFNLLKEHRVQFEKVAIVGNNIWHKVFAKLGEYFMAGEVRYFTDPHEAAAWIHE